jgi:hypothetical protein
VLGRCCIHAAEPNMTPCSACMFGHVFPQGPPPAGVSEVALRLEISSHLKQLGNEAYKQVKGPNAMCA